MLGSLNLICNSAILRTTRIPTSRMTKSMEQSEKRRLILARPGGVKQMLIRKLFILRYQQDFKTFKNFWFCTSNNNDDSTKLRFILWKKIVVRIWSFLLAVERSCQKVILCCLDENSVAWQTLDGKGETRCCKTGSTGKMFVGQMDGYKRYSTFWKDSNKLSRRNLQWR